jgi:hypothetical protein
MSLNLQQLFDLQHFAGNKRLQSVIDDTMSRYGSGRQELSMDELELNAAGDPFLAQGNELGKMIDDGENM